MSSVEEEGEVFDGEEGLECAGCAWLLVAVAVVVV